MAGGERVTAGEPSRRALFEWAGGAIAAAALAASPETALAATDITGLSAVDLVKAIRSRRVSCTEVMDAYLDRIDRVNPSVNAIVGMVERPALMAQAKAADEPLARREAVGPLHGLPMAVKDLQPASGLRFTEGSPIFRNRVATTDAPVVARQRRAGAIFLGKTNTPEFGLGSHTYNPVYGVTRNAFDHARSAGGSSGGAAVALALRMLPLADGSDYGGSLRNPAGWNNVVGFRTSIGRIPAAARDVWLPSMGVVGPMARSIADLCLLLSVQAGHDPTLPLSMEGDGSAFREPPKTSVKGRRIGFLGDFGGAAPCEPGVLDVCRRALRSFEAIGCQVEEARVDYPVDKAWDAFVRLRAWQQGGNLLAYYRDRARRALLKPEAVFEVETGLKLSAADITAASIVRTEWTHAVQRPFDRFDYLIAPTAQVFPFDVEVHWPREIAGKPMATYHEWMKGCCLVTMSGCPALAVPAGLGPGGLPMGVQIIAPVHREAACLELAAAYEAADPWIGRSPKI